jgi:PAS domain S-box-containing protein
MGIVKDKKLSAAELRRQAEKRLRAKTAELHFPRTEEATPRLVHELEVHQIELEMQNEELRRTQEGLESSHNKYVELYDFAPIGYFTLDAHGLIEGVNLTGAQMLRIERRLLFKRPFISFIAEATDREIFSNHLESVLQRQGMQTCEIRLKRKDGAAVFYAQIQSIAKENIDGEAGCISTAVIDITAHKKAEEKVEHLASFPELNPQPVIELDLKEQVIYCNVVTMNVLKELNVPEDVRFFLPRDLTEIIKKLKRGNDGQYLSREVEINGRVFAESLILSTKLKVVRIYAQEITERKRMEEALRESEEYFKEITENSSDVIIITDKNGDIKYCSRSIERFSGYKPEELIGRSGFKFIHPDDVERAVDDYGKAILTTDSAIPNEFRLVRKDGSIHYFNGLGRNLLDNPAVAGFVMNIRDITERRQAEEALKKVYEGLELKVEERTRELAGVNLQLTEEIKEHKNTVKLLQTALSEINSMKDQLEAENIYFRQENRIKQRFDHIIGQSDGLKYVLYRAEQVASSNTTVLILGETGVGKELIAFAVHDMSSRKERPLITVNCAALPGNLIESELFGREKGAFTGADIRRLGRFEIADGSSICLDEVGELPLELQAKLLRVIQHNEFERLGSSHTVKVDVRIIATTNRNLEEEVRKGRFRQDLYYRLNVFPITVPPLRQRKDDIPLMVQAFVERYSKKMGKQITSIPKETMTELQNYPWPGNVRELESIIERAVILCSGPILQLADKLEIFSPSLSSTVKTLEETERNQMFKILSETRWRIEGKNGAAAILGIHPSTLRARMHKLGIVRPETKESD